MKTYPVVEITFSPTGGTKKVADQISCYLGNITNTVNLIRHDVSFSDVTVPSDSLAVIAAPVFEGVIPDIAIERLKEIQGNHANCVVIAVYGNRAYDDGLIQLKDTAELCGFNVIASVAAVAEHSIMRQFSSGRPDEEDSKELKKFAEEILEKLSSDKELSTDYFVPGSHEYKRLGNLNVVPKASASCTGCEKCADACPTGAINKNNIRTGDSSKCISCMGCIAACPKGIRKLNPVFLAAASLKMKNLLSGRKPNEIFL